LTKVRNVSSSTGASAILQLF